MCRLFGNNKSGKVIFYATSFFTICFNVFENVFCKKLFNIEKFIWLQDETVDACNAARVIKGFQCRYNKKPL